MGNCQAIDAAALVIQHPDGRLNRMFRPVLASEVMKANPGHYVSLIIPLTTKGRGLEGVEGVGGETKKREVVRFTRIKLLRSHETLSLGHAYRLVTSQEVMKVLKAKKYGKMMTQRQQQELQHPDGVLAFRQQGKPEMVISVDHGKGQPSDKENNGSHNQGMRHQRHGQTVVGIGSRPKSWRPNLRSITEGAA
ncbi:hypothetical protein MLD38_040409 [Melastoma candidum]|uniref:Uncharacterized protein n=1 Tax=Melastoma candidum TaxID=119954 RepID=A0ACB9L608_9MYRT|nr:hypothetical protein MLD38_040409 [Melastoma candidum]